jgi:hypothetical protein
MVIPLVVFVEHVIDGGEHQVGDCFQQAVQAIVVSQCGLLDSQPPASVDGLAGASDGAALPEGIGDFVDVVERDIFAIGSEQLQ